MELVAGRCVSDIAGDERRHAPARSRNGSGPGRAAPPSRTSTEPCAPDGNEPRLVHGVRRVRPAATSTAGVVRDCVVEHMAPGQTRAGSQAAYPVSRRYYRGAVGPCGRACGRWIGVSRSSRCSARPLALMPRSACPAPRCACLARQPEPAAQRSRPETKRSARGDSHSTHPPAPTPEDSNTIKPSPQVRNTRAAPAGMT